MSSKLDALLELKRLAEDSSTYAALLADESTLQGIVLLLSNADGDIVELALQVLLSISRLQCGRTVLLSLIGLPQQLAELRRNGQTSGIQNSIETLVQVLRTTECENRTRESSKSDFPSRTKCKNFVIQLSGVNSEHDIETIRLQIVRVRGVVSITFQLQKYRVIVRTVANLDPQLLLDAIMRVNTNPPPSVDCTEPQVGHISARLVVRRPAHARSMIRTGSRRYVERPFKQVVDSDVIPMKAPAYLEDDADLFEVDESRAAPKLRNGKPVGPSDGKGAMGWLSDFLERSLFW